ncbi:hypothetical protein [Lentzea californiensis]|uniref:hypothetical protein n=1 Tax=Lentzea californiensis TaxID=438851 RepID=UPI0021662C40|nr:hypothetical protein [Lentzea californiensis]MCR3752898.1 hypothetical protein [Lentzea californiensis]
METKPYRGGATVLIGDRDLDCEATLVARSAPPETAQSFKGKSLVPGNNAPSGYNSWEGTLKFDDEQSAWDLYNSDETFTLRIDRESDFSAVELLADATVRVVGGHGDIPFD